MTGIVPPVPQIPAGWAPVQADVNAWVTAPFTFLSTKAAFRGQLQGVKALTANAYTLAQLDTVLEDPYGGWSATLTASQPAFSWLCPPGCSGWYEVSATAMSNNQGATATSLGAGIYVSGSLWQEASLSWGNDGNTSGSSGGIPVPLTGGADYVQLYIFSVAAVNTPATAGRDPAMEIMWFSS